PLPASTLPLRRPRPPPSPPFPYTTLFRSMLALHGTAQAATRAAAAQARADVKAGSAATGAPTTAWLAGASSGGPLSSLVGAPKGWLQRRRHRRSAVGRAAALQRLRDTSICALLTLHIAACAPPPSAAPTPCSGCATPASASCAPCSSTPAPPPSARSARLSLTPRPAPSSPRSSPPR